MPWSACACVPPDLDLHWYKLQHQLILDPVAQLDARPTKDQEVAGSTPHRGQQHSFVEIDHEIFSMVILSLPLIQEGQGPP